MKKPFFLTFLLTLLTLFSGAQVVTLGDFENGQLGSWGSWGAPVAVVANPSTSGNPSTMCASLDQSGGAWNGFRLWSDPSILSGSYKKIIVDVYMASAGMIQLYMDNPKSSGAATYTNAINSIPATTWTKLEFDLASLPALDYQQIAFQSNIIGVILFDNIRFLGPDGEGVKKVIARETFGNTAFDTNNPKPQPTGWGSGTAWHFNWNDITGFTSTNGFMTSGADSSLRINNYDTGLAKPDYWRQPSGEMHSHMAIRDGDAYKGSWDTIVYNDIDISLTYSVSAIEFGYARARTLSADTLHRSLNVQYSVDGGDWMQLDTSLINPHNVYGKWDYIVIPVAISGNVLDIRFCCLQPNEQIFLDDITVEASVPSFELTQDVISKETFGNTAYDTNNPKPQPTGWGSGTAWHFNWNDATTTTSTNGYLTAGSDSSLRINNYDAGLTKPDYWPEPSGNMHSHMAIRDGDAYKGSWDTLCFTGINISSAFSAAAIEFGYARARTLSSDTLHRSLNVEYRVDGGAWMQLDTSLINPRNVYGKWDYISIPCKAKGRLLDIRFACLQANEQIYLDDIAVMGNVQAPNGTNDFVVSNVVVGTVDNGTDFTCNLNLSWDADNAYLKFVITDDSLVTEGEVYRVDNIEVYFDLDNSKNIHWPRNQGWISADPTYDTNDFQLRLVPEDEFSANNSLKGVTQVYTKTDIGYNFDLTIAWDSLMDGFAPAMGTRIGFDILASDNDAVATDANRNQITLVSPTDKPFNDPSLFGTFQFEGMGTFSIIADTIAPGKATALTATPGKESVTLAWENATDNIAVLYYNVYQGTTLLTNKVYPKQTGNTLKISSLTVGDYSFSLEAVDNFGNISASKATVSSTVVSKQDLSSTKLSVYPNPAVHELNIKGVNNISYIEIIGIAGNVVKIHQGSSVINIADLSKGAYLVKVTTASEVYTSRFIKN